MLKLLKEAIARTRTHEQFIVLEGILNSHKLLHKEDRLEVRPMDELFVLDKEIGAIRSIISFTKEEYDKTEEDRKAEFPPPKPVVQVEVKKVSTEDEPQEEAPPEEERTHPLKPR